MNKITDKFVDFLNAELACIMKSYNKNRISIAKAGENGVNISAALEDEKVFEAKIKSIKDLLTNKKVVKFCQNSQTIVLGSKVRISGGGNERTFIIDGVGFKNDLINVISYKSLVGRALLGKKEGDTIQPYEVEDIEFKVEEISNAW